MKRLANIDSVTAMHKPCKVLFMKDIILLSVTYESGKVRHYFPKSEGFGSIPARIFAFIHSSLQYYPTNEMTVYRYGNQY